jgi:hypothetical protein
MQKVNSFMVSIDGTQAPRFSHPSFENALTEAVRLRNSGHHNKPIRILQQIAMIPPSANPALNFYSMEFYTDIKVSVGYLMDLIKQP